MEVCANLLLTIFLVSLCCVLIVAFDLGYIRYKKYRVKQKQKKESSKNTEGGLSGLMQLAVAAANVELVEHEKNKPKFGPVTDPDLLMQLRHYYKHVNISASKSRSKLSRQPSFNPSDDPRVLARIKRCSIKHSLLDRSESFR